MQSNEVIQMNSPDPASLQNLNDIVLPAPVAWWPLASGWYFLLGILFVALAWFGYRALQLWIKNRYRRAALTELRRLAEGIQNTENRASSLRQLPVLLKRTALSAYPRHQVASLSGGDWYGFLNSQLKVPAFTGTTTGLLDDISYSTGDLTMVDSQATKALLDTIEHWLKHHHPATRSEAGKET